MAHVSPPELLVPHVLRVKGFCDTPEVAATAGVDEGLAAGVLRSGVAAGEVLRRDGPRPGWSLTPAGRAAHGERLAAELEAAGARDVVDDAYRRFLALNEELLAVCTDWQLRTIDGRQVPNDHTDAAHDAAVIGRLITIHDRVRPVIVDLREALERFTRYGTALRSALERLTEGDHAWFTSPTIPSYHTVWFELHEDLLATLGIERGSEPSPEGTRG